MRGTVGKFGKGDLNENGKILLEFAQRHQLQLTNTMCKHKPAHITTWECPQRKEKHMDAKSNTIRRNPYRNQIDFILIKIKQNITVFDSRSYGGMRTNSDHKQVVCKLAIKWPYSNKQTKKPRRINLSLLKNPDYSMRYKAEIENKMSQQQSHITNQQRWTNIINITKNAAIETLGYLDPMRKSNNAEIRILSLRQRTLRLELNSTRDMKKKENTRLERNRVLTSIHNIIKAEESKKTENLLQPIIENPDNNEKMFEAIKTIQRISAKKQLLIKTKDGLTSNQEDQCSIISKHFEKQFFKNAEIPVLTPTKLTTPFTGKEIRRAILKLKNNKSPGIDDVTSEQLKHCPGMIDDEIAKIFNDMCETGEYPNEIIQGVLCPLQKPGKEMGPPENLRPVMLLSLLRKILAICIMKRINKRLDGCIPQSQAAYRINRSTTEHIFAIKLIIERTITAANETVYLLMHDMSKAFDCVNRKILIKDLETVVEKDELFLINELLKVEITVRCGTNKSTFFKTDTGVPQGDCSSANEFTFYLTNALKEKQNQTKHVIESDHNYNKKCEYDQINLNLEYADDITFITSSHENAEKEKEILPTCLASYQLSINNDKTEEYKINRTSNTWKKCKLLGSLLDTEEDIKRRKSLAISSAIKLNFIFQNKNVSLKIKNKVFSSFVKPIFMYNCEIWTLTEKIKKQIDSFQRRLIRTFILNVKWPTIVKNEQVYEKTNTTPWTDEIEIRQMKWFYKVNQLDENTPAKKALAYAEKTYKKPRGKPKTTWLANMKKHIKLIGLDWETAKQTMLYD